MTKKRGRPGKNPSIQEAQLKGMVQALSVTAEQLEKTNQILTTEASAVLEALWNGHQGLVSQVGGLQADMDRVKREILAEEAAEEALAIENEEIIRELKAEEAAEMEEGPEDMRARVEFEDMTRGNV